MEDEGVDSPLNAVSILLVNKEMGTVTDKDGFFQFEKLCKGTYDLRFSHVGCTPKQITVNLSKDTLLFLSLGHTINTLESVTISEKSDNDAIQSTSVVSNQGIIDNAEENLSGQLEKITGVSILKTGSGIAKPVVQGMFGNRLTILNNGVSQSGQQWGYDHSPEIDPLVANKLKVVKGVGALEYMGSNLGNIVIVEPDRIEKESFLHGRTSYFYETNGRGNGLNLQLEQYSGLIGWKVNGTLKKIGDRKAANYFLNNTGTQEANLAVQLEMAVSEKVLFDFYASTFNTSIGVLRGSHIGNLTDLEFALNNEVPFFTEEKFSYKIEAPKQKVHHHLFKLHNKFFIDNSQWFDFTVAVQINNRKEFDIRRGGRTKTPTLSLLQNSLFLESKFQKNFDNDLQFKTGLQFNAIDNTNNPETGILPLIPDYLQYESGIFISNSKTINAFDLELGIRYDHTLQKAATISSTLPRRIIRYTNSYHNISAVLGGKYNYEDRFKVSLSNGFTMRNPAINELYSGGLHQGVSGIEEGNIDLKTENSFKTTLGLEYNDLKSLTLESQLYFQYINDYIFLNPQDEIRLTIRGAFPVFKYEQTNAMIYGWDFVGRYNFQNRLNAMLKYSYIRGEDRSDDLPLINIPSNNLFASVEYRFSNIKWGNKKLVNQLFVEINNQYVFEQFQLNEEQDFVAPPKGYNLMGVKLSINTNIANLPFRFTFKAENLLNEQYRDYLNRQRYFADDLGRNIILGVQLKF